MSGKSDTSIYNEYFTISEEYTNKYGENTVLLLQSGTFFEVYGMKNMETGSIHGSPILPFSQICQLAVAEKSIQYRNHQILMAGFRDYALEKYLQKITENGYTAVVFVQEKVGTKVRRIFHSVHSAGTYIPYENDTSPQSTNNTMCIWFETHKTLLGDRKLHLTCGVAVSNVFTGKSSLFEYTAPFILNPTTFDELERILCTHSPSELIIVSPFDSATLQTILQYSGVKSSTVIHRVPSESDTAVRGTSQKYIKGIISTQYGDDAYSVCDEFLVNTVATQAFCYLLHFIQEHNPNLVRKICMPDFDGTADSRVLLINHTLKQLNIIDDAGNDDGRRCGQYSSVLSLLTKCSTSIGRRRMRTQILSPTYDEIWLNREYEITAYLLDSPDRYAMVDSLRKVLHRVTDIEKICRQLVTRRIYPSTLHNLWKSIECIQQINMCFYESPVLAHYLGQNPEQIDAKCSGIIDALRSVFNDKACATTTSTQTFPHNMVLEGVSPELDAHLREKDAKMGIYFGIRDALNTLIQRHTKATADVDYVKEHETDKLGLSLQITTKRGQILKAALDWLKMDASPYIQISCVDGSVERVHARDIKLAKATTTCDDIDCPLLTKTTRELLAVKDDINTTISRIYEKFIVSFEEKWLDALEEIVEYVATIDVLFCKVYIARKYNYARPVIEDCSGNFASKSYVDARGLRHALIEHIQQNELYVANDICLGKDGSCHDGILLYGTNAVGKTSLIRSLGIAVIMAQAGLYVPCASMTYKPYTAIFSRILGNDNLFKGMSTFAVEMSELRTILRMADEKSLILGDELCSGTETESALSIFMAGLMHLHDKRASFIFATHFHEIVHYEEMESLPNLALKHLSVYYDKERDCLIYDRILKTGSGTRMYGLEVCKSLYLPEDFLEKAYMLRNKYYPDTKGYLQMRPSKYNALKIRGICEICGVSMGEEIHHLHHQKYADEHGFIGGIHKNHSANLVSICSKCHDNIHKNDRDADEDNVSTVSSITMSTSLITDSDKKPRISNMRKKKTSKGTYILA